MLRPGERHFEIFLRLCRDLRLSGPIVSDAYHAALAIEHGCIWATADADVARFPELLWIHPLHTALGSATRTVTVSTTIQELAAAVRDLHLRPEGYSGGARLLLRQKCQEMARAQRTSPAGAADEDWTLVAEFARSGR